MSAMSISKLKEGLRRQVLRGRATPDNPRTCRIVDELMARGKYVVLATVLGTAFRALQGGA